MNTAASKGFVKFISKQTIITKSITTIHLN